ncbi:NAD(P)-dependent alcohol dehydrogenase [Myceligenerans crystallogenes]|uniref:alcohol dehydrogenase (NADP(+)) n=1 Tax=Myceligenerans crystallogenes TaxID=316335 RepID=A0ABN2N5M0_9MICO
MRTTRGWVSHGTTELRRAELRRRELRADDVAVRIDYCGVCHSDLHAVHAHDPDSSVPLVPGHEFTGTVTEVGRDVRNLAVGDAVAVGNIVDACLACDMCRAGQENFCRAFPTLTYGGVDRRDGTPTSGAFAREYVVREGFAYRLPRGLDPAAAAPLMCAGVTVWEPLRALGVGPGTRIAVIGLGGLGHLAVKLAVALGAETTVVSRSADKADDARRLGAQHLIVSTDEAAMTGARGQFDVVLDTIAVAHDLAPYLALLALDGELSLLGYLGQVSVETTDLLIGRKKLSSGGSGGRTRTAELLEFCAERGVVADIELLPSSRAGESLERLARGDVRYRFVLDMSDLDAGPAPVVPVRG